MGHNLCLHFGADEHPCVTYFDWSPGYRVLTYSHLDVWRLGASDPELFLRKYDDGKTEWAEIEDLKKLEAAAVGEDKAGVVWP